MNRKYLTKLSLEDISSFRGESSSSPSEGLITTLNIPKNIKLEASKNRVGQETLDTQYFSYRGI